MSTNLPLLHVEMEHRSDAAALVHNVSQQASGLWSDLYDGADDYAALTARVDQIAAELANAKARLAGAADARRRQEAQSKWNTKADKLTIAGHMSWLKTDLAVSFFRTGENSYELRREDNQVVLGTITRKPRGRSSYHWFGSPAEDTSFGNTGACDSRTYAAQSIVRSLARSGSALLDDVLVDHVRKG